MRSGMYDKPMCLVMALSFTGGAQAAVNPQNRGDNDTDLKRYARTIEVVAGAVSGNSFEIPKEMDGVLAMTNNVEDGKMMSWQELATRVGYSFYDFDGDGVNELVIGTNIEPYSNFPGRTMIHAIYTANGDKPECLLHGSSQKTWYYQGNGWFYMTGEENAAHVMSGQYSYINKLLNCEHYWFSTLNEAGDHVYYHSRMETADPRKGSKLNFDIDTYNSNDENNIGQAVWIDLTPFTYLRPITVKQSEGDKVSFSASQPLKDFRVIKLSGIDFVDGRIIANEGKVLLNTPLKAGQSVNMQMQFMGDLPEYAVSFTDALGERVKMLVTISGMDGSIGLSQY